LTPWSTLPQGQGIRRASDHLPLVVDLEF
ncbi:endonuclease, partial [Rhodospirillum rubrum]|nr:endonuclease [Rhodospirillum rubrum]